MGSKPNEALGGAGVPKIESSISLAYQLGPIWTSGVTREFSEKN